MRPQEPFETLLPRYRGLIFSLCKRYARRGVEVDDLIQDSSIAIWRVHEKILPLPQVQQAALVWKIARNAIIDTLRRTNETDALPEGYDEEAQDLTLVNELHEQIDLLEEPDRTIVRMQLEGYSYEEIGNALNITEKNVSVKLVRIKEKLRKSIVI